MEYNGKICFHNNPLCKADRGDCGYNIVAVNFPNIYTSMTRYNVLVMLIKCCVSFIVWPINVSDSVLKCNKMFIVPVFLPQIKDTEASTMDTVNSIQQTTMAVHKVTEALVVIQ